MRRIESGLGSVYAGYLRAMVERLRGEHRERREEERANDEKLLNEADGGVDMGDGVEPSSPAAPTAEPPLKIAAVTFYTEGNAKHHKTSKFELVQRGTPILRRGQGFYMAMMTPDRPFDETVDEIFLSWSFGPTPSIGNGTLQKVKLQRSLPSEEGVWAARIKGHDQNAITIEMKPSADTFVGIWKCEIETKTATPAAADDEKPAVSPAEIFKCPDDVYILFNPWEKSDVTYMTETELLDEYVLEDTGKIWVGPHGSSKGRHWIYGQFDDSVLPLLMILLEKSGLAFTSRGNPILVSRALSKMVNSNDDDGILVGRWDGKYTDGTPPSGWTGSVAILEKYFADLTPVKYGQCWVFSGVLCTVCRALGIPARVVSNLVSAHDANSTLTIDRYFDEKNEEIEYDPNNPTGGKDSIWNFHVWNDVWFARPDLPMGYGGWQALDATPQEQSEGVYQCGPASVEAVRKGRVGYAYDVPFVLAEVNADLVRWKKDESSDFGYIRMTADKYHVGRMILTKQPNFYDSLGDSDRMDIIDEYKPKEGSRTERLQLVNAVRGSATSCPAEFFQLKSTKAEDVAFDLIDLEGVPVGDPFSLVVTIENTSEEDRTIQADLSADSMYYTGVKAKSVKKASGKFVVKPNSREELRLTVQPEEYMDKLVEYGIMKIFAICLVDETNQAWSEEDDLQVIKPPLILEVSDELKVGKPAYVTFSFLNPIKKKLTQCVINYEGPGLTRNVTIKMKEVDIDKEMKYTHRFIPKASGSQRLVATFTSKQLIDIVGSTVIEVE